MAFLKKSPTARDPHADVQACLRNRDYKGALAAFEAILKGNPRSTQMRMRYADTLVLARQKADAIREYRRVAEEMAETGFLLQAVAVYKKIIKLDPSQGDVLERLARLDAERQEAAPAPMVSIPEEEESDDGEIDIGAQFGLGSPVPGRPAPGASPTAPASLSPASPARPAAAAPAELHGHDDLADALDLAPDDLHPEVAAPIARAQATPAARARVTPAPEPEVDLESLDEHDLAPQAGDLETGDLAPEPAAPAGPGDAVADLPSFDFGLSGTGARAASAPVPPATSGFDFGIAAEPARKVPADTPAALFEEPAASGFDFGIAGEPAPAAAQAPAPATRFAEPAASGFDFGIADQAVPDAPLEEPDPFAEPDAAGLAFGGTDTPGAAPEVSGDDLVSLLGDDIDAMLDGILSDVGSDEQRGGSQMPTANTHIPLFAHLDIDEYIEVLKVLDRRVVRPGETVVNEGEPGHSMFIISNGKVQATVTKGAESVPIATLVDGHFFGEMAVLSGGPRTATVTALETTELLELDRAHLDEILSRFPGIEAKLRLAYEERAQSNRALD